MGIWEWRRWDLYPVTVKASIVSLQQVTRRCRWQLWFRVSLRFLSTQASKAAFPSLGSEAEAFIKSPCLRNTHGGVSMEVKMFLFGNDVPYFAITRSPCSTLRLSWRESHPFSSSDMLLQQGWRALFRVHTVNEFTQGTHGSHISFILGKVRFSCCNVLRKNTGIYTYIFIVSKSGFTLRKWHSVCESQIYQCMFYRDDLARSFLVLIMNLILVGSQMLAQELFSSNAMLKMLINLVNNLRILEVLFFPRCCIF